MASTTLAPRGHELASGPDFRESFGRVLADPFDVESNPNGVVNLAASENHVMTPEVSAFANKVLSTNRRTFTYGEGPWGTKALRQGMARFMNEHFRPSKEVKEEEILPANGVTSLVNMLAFNLFEHGDGVLLGRPIYQAFEMDFGTKAGVRRVYASFGDRDQFSPACVEAYEKAYEDAEAKGIKIRALLLCNPHNPLGQCYPSETIAEVMKFCSKRQIHLISDEIYALSVYDVADPHAHPFTSALSFNTNEHIDEKYLHVLYGFSKDFACGGLRQGVLQTRNKELMHALSCMTQFHWTGSLDSMLAAQLLAAENEEWRRDFFALSRERLAHRSRLSRQYLEDKKIKFHLGANAGFFLWLDLRPFLALTGKEGWDAETALMDRLMEREVFINPGMQLQTEEPGWFRLIFAQEEDVLKEGFRRIFEVLQV